MDNNMAHSFLMTNAMSRRGDTLPSSWIHCPDLFIYLFIPHPHENPE